MIPIDEILQDSLLSQVHNGGNKWSKRKKMGKYDKKSLNNAKLFTITSGQKWWMAVIVGFIFFIIASPSFFKLTQKLTNFFLPIIYCQGQITLFGLFVHTLIFIIIIRIILY